MIMNDTVIGLTGTEVERLVYGDRLLSAMGSFAAMRLRSEE